MPAILTTAAGLPWVMSSSLLQRLSALALSLSPGSGDRDHLNTCWLQCTAPREEPQLNCRQILAA